LQAVCAREVGGKQLQCWLLGPGGAECHNVSVTMQNRYDMLCRVEMKRSAKVQRESWRPHVHGHSRRLSANVLYDSSSKDCTLKGWHPGMSWRIFTTSRIRAQNDPLHRRLLCHSIVMRLMLHNAPLANMVASTSYSLPSISIFITTVGGGSLWNIAPGMLRICTL